MHARLSDTECMHRRAANVTADQNGQPSGRGRNRARVGHDNLNGGIGGGVCFTRESVIQRTSCTKDDEMSGGSDEVRCHSLPVPRLRCDVRGSVKQGMPHIATHDGTWNSHHGGAPTDLRRPKVRGQILIVVACVHRARSTEWTNTDRSRSRMRTPIARLN